jgi:hypothetical protein
MAIHCESSVLRIDATRYREHETAAKKRGEDKKWNPQSQKFFNTNLVRAKINTTIKEILMGHSIQSDGNITGYIMLEDNQSLKRKMKMSNRTKG